MRPNQKRTHSRQAIDPRSDPRLLSIQVKSLKRLTLAFLAEVETLDANRHVDIEDGLSLREEVRRFEIDLIKFALQRTGGNQTRAAALLGVKLTTLNAKVKLYQLQPTFFSCVAGKDSASRNISTHATPSLAFDSIVGDQGKTAVG